MTKKDYERIAAALAAASPTLVSQSDRIRETGGPIADRSALWVWERVKTRLADALAADNPRFDRSRFYAACGYQEVTR